MKKADTTVVKFQELIYGETEAVETNWTSATKPMYLYFHQVLPLPKQPEIITTTTSTEEELMDPKTWDWDNVATRPGNKRRARAVVSVAFSAKEFEIVSDKAERLGKYMSAYIREVALRAAKR